MDQWYAYVGQQRYGPISFGMLCQWAQEGRLKPEDLVWKDGMPEWAKAGTVAGLFTPPAPATPRPLPGGGTGGQTPNAGLTAQAREQLRGKWWPPIAAALIVGAMEMGARSIPYIGWVVSLIITGPIELGAAMYFLALTRGGKPDIEMVFGGFRDFGRSLGACVLMGLFVFLWALLLIIPGIIAALAYSQTYYLLVDYPELGAMDAITRSREMMRGHKGRLFCLHLRFFLWGLLCILTLGIGFIWLAPYMRVTFARFYDDLREPAPVHDFVPEMPPGPAV